MSYEFSTHAKIEEYVEKYPYTFLKSCIKGMFLIDKLSPLDAVKIFIKHLEETLKKKVGDE